jgi:hypothetical protein
MMFLPFPAMAGYLQPRIDPARGPLGAPNVRHRTFIYIALHNKSIPILHRNISH